MSELRFHPDIYDEVRAAYRYYEERAQGLGDDFIHQLETAYGSIRLMPAAWPPLGRRRAALFFLVFPIAWVYKTYADHCLVVAVMHQSQKSGYWKNRH